MNILSENIEMESMLSRETNLARPPPSYNSIRRNIRGKNFIAIMSVGIFCILGMVRAVTFGGKLSCNFDVGSGNQSVIMSFRNFDNALKMCQKRLTAAQLKITESTKPVKCVMLK